MSRRPRHTGGGADGTRLEGDGISVSFGGVAALSEVTIALEAGEVLGLIGPNGSGKTTLVNVLSGFQRTDAGHLRVGGVDLTGRSPRLLSRRGIGRTFQGVRLFKELTVWENVVAGALGGGVSRREALALTSDLLERTGLSDLAETRAGVLAYGAMRRVSVARTLATKPRFLLLDEPAAGLNETESDDLVRVVRDARETTGCGVLIVEHDMRLIMGLCDRLHVLDSGRTIAIGTPAEIQRDEVVREAYLGSDE